MKVLSALMFGLFLSGCVSCLTTKEGTGETSCNTYQFAESCPANTVEVESCD